MHPLLILPFSLLGYLIGTGCHLLQAIVRQATANGNNPCRIPTWRILKHLFPAISSGWITFLVASLRHSPFLNSLTTVSQAITAVWLSPEYPAASILTGMGIAISVSSFNSYRAIGDAKQTPDPMINRARKDPGRGANSKWREQLRLARLRRCGEIKDYIHNLGQLADQAIIDETDWAMDRINAYRDFEKIMPRLFEISHQTIFEKIKRTTPWMDNYKLGALRAETNAYQRLKWYLVCFGYWKTMFRFRWYSVFPRQLKQRFITWDWSYGERRTYLSLPVPPTSAPNPATTVIKMPTAHRPRRSDSNLLLNATEEYTSSLHQK